MSTNFFENNLCIRQKQHPEIRYVEYTNMNSSLVAISTLMNSSLSKKGMANIPMKFTNEALKEYLEAAKIYKGKRERQTLQKWYYLVIS